MSEPSTNAPATNSLANPPSEAAPQATPPASPPAPPAQVTQSQPAPTPGVDPAAQPAAPSSYSLTVPEGVTIAPEVVSAFAEKARAAGVTQEAAQTMLAQLAPVVAQQDQTRLSAQVQQWQAQAAADARFGGAERQPAVAASVDLALEKAGSPALRELLQKTGLIHHPDLRHVIYQAGMAMAPAPAPVRGTPAAAVTPRLHGLMTPAAAAKAMGYGPMK